MQNHSWQCMCRSLTSRHVLSPEISYITYLELLTHLLYKFHWFIIAVRSTWWHVWLIIIIRLIRKKFFFLKKFLFWVLEVDRKERGSNTSGMWNWSFWCHNSQGYHSVNYWVYLHLLIQNPKATVKQLQ